MARGKKKESALTPEEKLAQALVSDWEQPYEVPKNWCWVRLEKLYEVNPKNNADDSISAAFIPMEKIEPGMVSSYTYEVQPWGKARKGHTQFADGDVAFAKISPCFENRKSMIVADLPNGIGGGTTELIVLRQAAMNQKYTFWFISDEQFIRGGMATYSGTVGQQRISMDYVRSYPVPVPPITEQQRIVDRVEYLFAKLDEAKEKAQSVLESFETRKAAILHKAFTGELTAKWRAEHGGRFDAWRTLSVSDIGDVITGSTPDTKKPEYYGGEVPFVKPTELNQGRYVEAAADTLTEAGRGVSRPVRAGSTCVCCIGATISKCGFLIIDAVTNQQINTIVPYSFMDDAFVYYYCISNRFKNSLIDNSSSTTLPIINKKKMSALEFVAPPKEEQTEIVRILDSLFAKEQQAKEAAEAVLEKIDLLKKSILARAFRGELGTNDPAEESAVELLKTIL